MSNEFKNRVFGCAIIKSINSNYNADFSHQPRRLPDGIVYATDKALKYSIRNYWVNNYSELLNSNQDLIKQNKETIFYFQRPRYDGKDIKVHSMDTNYALLFGNETPKGDKKQILTNLLNCIDIRLFGATFTGASNVSIHGVCQITHGINRYDENFVYTEQIKAPQNPDLKADMTTLGTQSKLREGHYVHHFSVNPKNIDVQARSVGSPGVVLTDIQKLKEGLRKGVTYYDSSAKAGTENEVLFWVQLKEDSKIVLPSFVELIDINLDREIDLAKVTAIIDKSHIKSEVDKIEAYYNPNTKVKNLPQGTVIYDLEGQKH